MAHGKVQSLSLAHRIVGDPLVASQDLPFLIHKVSGSRHLSGRPLDEGRVVVIRDKAYLHAVLFLCHGKPHVLCHLADLLFCEVPHRHQSPRKLVLGQVIKGIRLVLLGRHGIPHRIPAVGQLKDPGIMARGDIIRPDLQAPGQKGLPFHIPVAGNAWIGRPPVKILFHKVIHHRSLEFLPEIHHIIRDPQAPGHLPGVLHGGQAAAAPVFRCLLRILILPDLHGHSDHIVALLL